MGGVCIDVVPHLVLPAVHDLPSVGAETSDGHAHVLPYPENPSFFFRYSFVLFLFLTRETKKRGNARTGGGRWGGGGGEE